MVPAFAWNRARDNAITAALEKARVEAGATLSLALFTNVLENASDLYGAGDAALLHQLFGEPLPARLPGVMSRKKDFLPWLGEKLRRAGRA
jgi:manganese-dependent inorganic pyrophosphatase